MASSLDAPLLSDDYSLLIETRTLVWGEGFDHLYRPLRNSSLRWLATVWPVADAAPYRILGAAFSTMFLWQFALLVWRVEKSSTAGYIALVLLGFYPRMGELFYWFSVLQDLCVLTLGLASIHFFLLHRERGGWKWMAGSCLAISIALGFKETAIILLPLLVLVDLRFSWRRGDYPWHWKRYLPLCTIALFYLAVVFLDLRHDSGTGSLQRGAHGLRSLAGIGSNLVRSLVAIFWPWAPLSSVWEMMTPLNLAASLTGVTLTWLSLGASRLPAGVAAAMGMASALAPTVLFGPYVTDRYVLSAALIPLWILATGAARLIESVSLGRRALGCALLLPYSLGGFLSLRADQAVWLTAGLEADRIRKESYPFVQHGPQVQKVWGIRIPARTHGEIRKPILGNGFRGILLYNGLSPESVVIENFDTASQPGIQEFWRGIAACPPAIQTRSDKDLFLDLSAQHVASKDAACAMPLAEAFAHTQPEAFLRRTKEVPPER